MTRSDIYKARARYFNSTWIYRRCYYKDFDYKILNNIMYIKQAGKKSGKTYNDCIIMLDTETSKEIPGTVCKNYIVAWTISIRAFNSNIVTLYGHKPTEAIECINMFKSHFTGDNTIIYVHHLAYDWTFLRKYMMAAWGLPEKQLNIKSHYPLFINFENGLMFRDSLILAQRKLEKWANDLQVEHRKAVGKWDYNKKRNQSDVLTEDELDYIEYDTLSGVECIQATMDTLHKHVYSMPYTSTGIPREHVRDLASSNRGRDLFKKVCLPFDLYLMAEKVFHGGYTHGNRHILGQLIKENVICYDFVSDYPFQLLSKKFPMQKFVPLGKPVKPSYILDHVEKYAFMFKLIINKPHLINDEISMPALQYSKCTKIINPVLDNGRILCAEYVEIYTNEVDLQVISKQYDLSHAAVSEVVYSKKAYLPRWFTDYVYECFSDKCKLKGGDPVLYSIAKAKLNSLYGMCVQKSIKPLINEIYITNEELYSGDYVTDDSFNGVEEYQKYLEKYSSVLPYQWGVWVTSYAMRSLFELGECCENWLYSDTDSCYGFGWDVERIELYNNKCKDELRANGYGPVEVNNKDYWLGIAELDGEYSEFITLGAKRYACRLSDDEVKITVAGVPKKGGAKCMKNDLTNFHKGFLFDGQTTGKLQHTYFYIDDTYIDDEGNERGDSIDLSPTTYLLDTAEVFDWESIFMEEIDIQVYEEDN